jgi:hypothetical protein
MTKIIQNQPKYIIFTNFAKILVQKELNLDAEIISTNKIVQ